MPIQIETSTLEAKSEVIKADVNALITQIGNIKVKSKEDLAIAANYLGEIKTRLKRLEMLRKEATQPLNDYVSKLNNSAKVQSAPLKEGQEKIEYEIKIFMDEEDRKARAEAARLRQEQEERERVERQKMEEARRKEEIARQKELEASRALEEAKNKKEREAAQKQLEAARKKAEQEAAKVIESLNKLDVAEVQVIEEPKKSVRTEAGLVTRKLTWTWEVENELALKKAHPELFILDEKAVNQLVRDGARNIPGLRIFQESSSHLRQ